MAYLHCRWCIHIWFVKHWESGDCLIGWKVDKNIFQNDWICAGHISEFSQSGSFKVINNSNESALITKDNDGSINAFYNLCRHRGTRIKNKPCGKFKNNIRIFFRNKS